MKMLVFTQDTHSLIPLKTKEAHYENVHHHFIQYIIWLDPYHVLSSLDDKNNFWNLGIHNKNAHMFCT